MATGRIGTKKCAAIAALAVLALSAAAQTDVSRKRPNTAPTAEGRREMILARTGGLIAAPEKGPWIAIVSGNGGAGAEAIAEAVAYIRNTLRLRVREAMADDALAAAKKEIADGAAIAVAICEDPTAPSLTVFPTGQYGILNPAPLATEDAALFAERVRKEFLRCVAYTFGVGNATGKCVMKPANGVEGLDANPMRNYSPETLVAIMKNAQGRGMAMARTVSYRRAVQEGWAQPPTNDYQRAIWDEIHSATNAAAKTAE
jgi:hypothetical protein